MVRLLTIIEIWIAIWFLFQFIMYCIIVTDFPRLIVYTYFLSELMN